MNIKYEDLLSGEPIYIEGVGQLRSPQVSDLKPSGIGINKYNMFLSILSWDKQDFISQLPQKQADIFSQNAQLNLFDMMAVILADFREILHQALSFFIVENVEWDENALSFITYACKGSCDDNAKCRMQNAKLRQSDLKRLDAADSNSECNCDIVGKVSRDNFDTVSDLILQLNYISTGKDKQPKFSSETARRLWEIEQQKKKEAKSSDSSYYRLGNIISKLCASNVGYTLHNVYDLTVYQLMDQFLQTGHLRARSLNEKAFAAHGGEKFNFNEWLTPLGLLV